MATHEPRLTMFVEIYHNLWNVLYVNIDGSWFMLYMNVLKSGSWMSTETNHAIKAFMNGSIKINAFKIISDWDLNVFETLVLV